VSELYAYNALPYVSLIVGAGLGQLLALTRPGSLWRGVVIALLVALLASLAVAVVGKARMMHANGERAGRLLEQVARHLGDVAPGGEVVLVDPDSGERSYAVFLLPRFDPLGEYCRHRLRQLAGRPDLNVRQIKQSQVATAPIPPGSVLLTLEGDRVVVYRRPDK
jgi:hypothetical protein